MDDELLEGAACAGSDLAARLHAELARANDSLALAEARLRAQAAGGDRADRTRVEARRCRRHVASLLAVLSGMPDFAGGCHAASA